MSFDLRILNGDLAIASTGDLQKVENNDKLIQDLLKIAITPIGSNPFYKWYGSPVSKSLIGSSFDGQFISTMASGQLRSSIEILQKMQKEQANRQVVSSSELLAAIQEVRVERNIVDPRFFTVIIRALTKAFTPIKTEFTITGL